ncbi:hypothetical protein BDN72DRAFT_405962 [Pluteus cervinus]|uniref:Uncharacterized protein n=1 Tax=Pluteus cervinus TaxID=181527 RepID=A0ACD3A924_9AGAR|nr:hypothetical protein BDN72DRAFT_405962 [Pluteus cervinus]
MRDICSWCRQCRPQSKLKKCIRCLDIRYCSRKCQKKAWVNGHKKTCMPHPEAENFLDKRVLKSDKAFARWVDTWRSILLQYAVFALDLANHPFGYNMTKVVIIWIAEPGDPPRGSVATQPLRHGMDSIRAW